MNNPLRVHRLHQRIEERGFLEMMFRDKKKMTRKQRSQLRKDEKFRQKVLKRDKQY